MTYAACDVNATACLALPNAGEIPYTLTGPFGAGANILLQYAKVQLLASQYANDPIALGAYANEEAFFQRELVGLGLGYFDTQGVFHLTVTGSPANYAADQTALNTATTAFNIQTSGVWSSGSTLAGQIAAAD